MAVTFDATLQVGMRELLAAFKAVVPHAEPTKNGDEVSPNSRVRIVADKDEVHLLATCTITSAMASVGIVKGGDSRLERFAPDDGPLIVDVAPWAIRKLVQQFKAKKAGADAEPQWGELFIGPSDDGLDIVRLTDRTALFAGMRSEMPQIELASDFPDVVKAVSKALEAAAGDMKPLVVKSGPLGLFQHAGLAYGEPLQYEPTGSGESRGFLVICGEKFIGTISSGHNDDDSLKRRGSQRRKHMERLGLATPLASVG